jgi:putative alpha-1,2-mannosidase
VRIGSSFISLDQARENLRREIPNWDFDRLAGRTRREWNDLLKRIEIEGGTPDEQTVFYTAMYHVPLFPRTFSEYGRYYSAFDEKIHRGVSYNDYSTWDTFRALHPLATPFLKHSDLFDGKLLEFEMAEGGGQARTRLRNATAGQARMTMRMRMIRTGRRRGRRPGRPL